MSGGRSSARLAKCKLADSAPAAASRAICGASGAPCAPHVTLALPFVTRARRLAVRTLLPLRSRAD